MLFCCHSSLLNGEVKFFQGKYVLWHTCPADDIEKKPTWIHVNIACSAPFKSATKEWKFW